MTLPNRLVLYHDAAGSDSYLTRRKLLQMDSGHDVLPNDLGWCLCFTPCTYLGQLSTTGSFHFELSALVASGSRYLS